MHNLDFGFAKMYECIGANAVARFICLILVILVTILSATYGLESMNSFWKLTVSGVVVGLTIVQFQIHQEFLHKFMRPALYFALLYLSTGSVFLIILTSEFDASQENLALLRQEVLHLQLVLWLPILIDSFATAVWEEIFFRKILFGFFEKTTNSFLPGMLVSSLLFSALHWPRFFMAFIAGIFFALIYYVTKKLALGIVLHAFHDFVLFGSMSFNRPLRLVDDAALSIGAALRGHLLFVEFLLFIMLAFLCLSRTKRARLLAVLPSSRP